MGSSNRNYGFCTLAATLLVVMQYITSRYVGFFEVLAMGMFMILFIVTLKKGDISENTYR